MHVCGVCVYEWFVYVCALGACMVCVYVRARMYVEIRGPFMLEVFIYCSPLILFRKKFQLEIPLFSKTR